MMSEIIQNMQESSVMILGTYRSNEVDSENSLMKMHQSLAGSIDKLEIKPLYHKRLNSIAAAWLGRKLFRKAV